MRPSLGRAVNLGVFLKVFDLPGRRAAISWLAAVTLRCARLKSPDPLHCPPTLTPDTPASLADPLRPPRSSDRGWPCHARTHASLRRNPARSRGQRSRSHALWLLAT